MAKDIAMYIARIKLLIIVIFGIVLSLGMLFYLKWTQENPIFRFSDANHNRSESAQLTGLLSFADPFTGKWRYAQQFHTYSLFVRYLKYAYGASICGNGQPGGLRLRGQTAGGHRPHRRRIH